MWHGDASKILTVTFVNECIPYYTTCCWFYTCINLTTINNIENLDTSRVKDMYYMFSKCSSLINLDLSSFDTSNVTQMYFMFSDCSSLTNLNLSNFDTRNTTHMYGMFSDCINLTTIITGSNWVVSSNSTGISYNCPTILGDTSEPPPKVIPGASD